MSKRVKEDDADGSKDTPDVIAGRRRAIVSSRFRRKTLPASVQAPSPFARVQISSTSTGPAVEEKDGASGEASATKRIAFSQDVSPSSITNSSESEGNRRKSVSPAPAPAKWSGGFSFPSMAPAPAPAKWSGGFSFPSVAPAPAPAKWSGGFSSQSTAAAPASAASNGFSFSVTASAPAPVKESSIVGAEFKPTSTSLPVAANSGATGEVSAGNMNAFCKTAAPSSDFGSLSTGSKQRSTAVPADSVGTAPTAAGFAVDVHSRTSNEASAANKNALSLGDSKWTVSDSSTAENNRVNASVPGCSAPSATGFSSPPAALKRSEMKPLLEATSPSFQPSAVHHTASSPMIEIESANLANNSTNVETSALPSAPFGDGLTAVKGVNLNKRIMSWISHQFETAPECSFDAGLLDYVVHAAEIRTRVAFSKADAVSKVGTAFNHAFPTAALTYLRSAPPKPTPAFPVSSTAVAQVTQLSTEAAPAPAPEIAVAPAGSATTGFYFSPPSTLPTPSGTSTIFSSRAPQDPSEKQAPAPAAATTLPQAARGFLFPSKAPQAPSGEEAPSLSVTSTLAPAPLGKLLSSKAPAPALNPTPTPASSAMSGFFHTPSTLPPAPPVEKFSFKLPSAPAFTSTSAAVTALAKSSSSSSSSPSLNFKFGPGLPGSGFQSTFTGFKVPGGVAVPPLSAGGTAGGAADDEEAEMPKDDPAQLERAPGEENETVLRNFRAKLFIFKNEERTWADLGVGVLRLMEHKTDGTRRFILRNDMGKVLLNAGFYKGMNVIKTKNSISFLANMAEGDPKNVMLKVTANEIQDLHNTVLSLLPTS